MKKSFSIEHLYTFVAFNYYEFRIPETSKRLGLGRHSLQIHMRQLENDLGVRLFERRPIGWKANPDNINWTHVTLTPAGKKLLARSVSFMTSLDDLATSVQRASLQPA